ncbi:hypothetical protein RJ55_06013 [Drechmeria coniospora]|nr:hypothetical protein RJ55_06013 [Drechmeria coniospora]
MGRSTDANGLDPLPRSVGPEVERQAVGVAFRPLNILIVGAGIAGPAVAFWLARLGHSCTVVERAPGLRTGGQQIDLRDQGIDAARRMGILEEVRRCGVDERGALFVDASGQPRAFIPRSPPGQTQTISSEFQLMRGSLCRLLFEASARQKGRVVYRFGVVVESFDDRPTGVRVGLSDGSVATYDLLVGADGLGSGIRKRMLAQHGIEDEYRSTGAFCCYFGLRRRRGPTPAGHGSSDAPLRCKSGRETGPQSGSIGAGWSSDAAANVATICHMPRARFAMTRWHTATRGQAYLFTMAHAAQMRAALGSADTGRKKAAFARAFADGAWQVPHLLRTMHAAADDDFHAAELVQATAGCWARGRVVLLGDAGYAPSPFSAMGTSLALVGAYVLAGEIARRPTDLPAAAVAYAENLRPLVDGVQHLPPGVPDIGFPATDAAVRRFHLLVWLLSLVLRLVLALRVDLAMAALRRVVPGGRKGAWLLPDYPELDQVEPWKRRGDGTKT